MPESKPVVYLEDLEAPQSSPANAVSDEKENAKVAAVATSSSVTKMTNDASNKSTVTKTTTKRQATLMDMFSGSSSQPNKKKIKIENSTSSVGPETEASTSTENAGRSLNSIPFSISGYTESLSDDERRLLGLECETMGKSWFVPMLSVLSPIVSRSVN